MTRSAQGGTAPPATEGIGIEIVDGGMRMIATRATDRAASGRRWRRQLATPPTADEALAALNELIGQVCGRGRSSRENTRRTGRRTLGRGRFRSPGDPQHATCHRMGQLPARETPRRPLGNAGAPGVRS